MIVFATAVTRPDVYERCARPGIERSVEGDSVVVAEPSRGSISESYNALLDAALQYDDLDALVLLHQDTEIVSQDFCEHVREAFADPQVAIVGCVGAVGVRSIAWWEGSVTLASFANRYEELGGGEMPAFSWNWEQAPAYAQIGEVDTVDGFLLALSPWVVQNIRFDESLSRFHGYDLDVCLQVREAQRKVVTADVRAIHHRPLEMIPDPEEWVDAHISVAEKWDGRMPGIGAGFGTWEERALRAEAERDVAKARAHTTAREVEAHVRQLEGALQEARTSIGWRLTAPLRWFS